MNPIIIFQIEKGDCVRFPTLNVASMKEYAWRVVITGERGIVIEVSSSKDAMDVNIWTKVGNDSENGRRILHHLILGAYATEEVLENENKYETQAEEAVSDEE